MPKVSSPPPLDQPFFHELQSEGPASSNQNQQQKQTPPSVSSSGTVPTPTATQLPWPIKKVAIVISTEIVTLGMLSALAIFLYRHRAKHLSET